MFPFRRSTPLPLTVVLFSIVLCVGIPDSRADLSEDWFWQNPLPQGQGLNGVVFVDAATGTAVGDGGMILHTTNGNHCHVVWRHSLNKG